jgi:hypothetical protein
VLLQFLLDPSAQLLQPTAEFVRAYANAKYHPRTAERVALASHVLVENAMNYGSVSGSVAYSLVESHTVVEICVSNDSSPGRISSLQGHLDRLKEDAEQVYLQEMGKSMSGSTGRVALGLARICHEAQMDLEFELDASRVTMRARCSR